MRELELDGIHDDGDHVVLSDSDGGQYTLRITEALRAAVRRDRPALGALQAASTHAVSPKEIQSLLRSGRSAEEIAEIAEVPVEHVRRYEGPVLAERRYIAERATSFHVGRGGPALADVVAERLRARQASEETAWDAWRRPDGTWTLELVFSAAERTRQAHWVVDMDTRTATPLDDEARWMSEEDGPSEPIRARARLTAIRSTVYDVEADGSFEGGRDSGEDIRRHPAGRRGDIAPAHPSAIDEAELDAINARRGLRPVPSPAATDSSVWTTLDEDVPEEDADTRAAEEHAAEDPTPADDEPEEHLDAIGGGDSARDDAEERGLEPYLGDDPAEVSGPHEDERESIRTQETVDLTPLPGFDIEPSAAKNVHGAKGEKKAEAEEGEEKPTSRRKGRRPSMPSWDEIVFGTKHD